ncbi:phage tail tape measure protein [Clostridium estertheticum]|uniref:phage tail length tape measure family protein n=1 Tax=Clostridium estertheticum TaxID=238834 RepID=UPI00124EEAA5|nr:phage tail length tape measure family protein [Clostridium estertheticum]MBZ9615292.1 phage tail length tape measure family protein [Clostridium estertheticum subsp. laramiense]WAG75181.1 phage tail length tape measure family protein [Clostridium estertheticum]
MTMQLSAIMNLTGNFAAQIQKNAELMKGIKGQADQAGSSIRNAFSNSALGQKMASGISITRDAFGAAGIASAGFLKVCVEGATKAQKTNADLAQTIKSTGGAAGLTAAQVSAMATSLSKTTTFGAGAIKTGQNMLLTFTNIGKNVFPMASQAMLDLAQKMGGDPVSSSVQLGKALNDPIKGITALSRVGVTFTEQQKKQIETMQKAGNMAGAQKLILNELNKEFGGQAAAAAKTYDGQMKQLGNTIGSIKATIGSALLPYLQGISEKLNSGAQSVASFVGQHKKLVVAVLSMTAVFGTLVGGIGLFTKISGVLGPAVSGIGGLIGGLSLPILIVIGAIAGLVIAYTKNFGGLKTFIDGIVGGISSAFKMATSQFKKTGDAIGAIGVFITNVFGTKVGNTVTASLTMIKTIVLSTISTIKSHMPQIKAVVQSVFQGVAALWISVLKPVLSFMITEIGKVVQWVIKNFPLIKQTISTILNGAMSVIKIVLSGIQAFWSTWGQTIMDYVSICFNGIKIIIDTVIHVVQDVIKAVMQIITGDWKGAWSSMVDAAKTIFGGVGALISNVLNGVGKIFVDIAKVAIGWGKDMIDGIITGIKGAIGGIGDAVKGVADKIKSFLHFSVPDEGPLTLAA